MRCHWISETRKLNRHYQSGEEGEPVRYIVREYTYSPTFPRENLTAQNIRTGYQGRFQMRVRDTLQTGDIIQHVFTNTQQGKGFPFNTLTREILAGREDRQSRIYSRYSGHLTNFSLNSMTTFYINCDTLYHDNGVAKRDGVKPWKIVLKSSNYHMQYMQGMADETDSPVNIVRFGGDRDRGDGADFENFDKIIALYNALKRPELYAGAPRYEYIDGQWVEGESGTQGNNPANLPLGYTGDVYISDRFDQEHGSARLTGKNFMPETVITL